MRAPAGTPCSPRSSGRAIAADAAGRGAVRSRGELVSGAAGGAVAVPAGADRHSGDARRRQLQGRHAEIGAGYDVFGTGKTALKMSLGKYLEGAGVVGNYANTNPTLRMPQTTSVVRHGRA